MLLRALLPAGFMPVALPGGLSVQLCPDAAAGVAASQPLHAHQGVHHGGPGPASGHHVPCLYAASAAAPFAPPALSLPVAYLRPLAPAAAAPATRRAPAIERTQSPRGPPTATL